MHLSYMLDILRKMAVGLQLSFEVFDVFLDDRQVLNQKGKQAFQYKKSCFHEKILQKLWSFLSEYFLECYLLSSEITFTIFE